jgi:monoamine oxidase
MKELPIIVLGAGSAGLIASRELLRQNKKIILLEASERAGGRIHSIKGNDYLLESGAEFVHGKLPLTISLLQEYRIQFSKVSGMMARVEKGSVKKTNEFVKDWDKLLDAMKKLKTDIPLAQFLSENFGETKYKQLRDTASRFAEGFDLADINTVSTQGLYQEWTSDEDEEQYRVHGGYVKLVDAILNDCIKKGCDINFSAVVKKIEWKKDNIKVHTGNGKEFNGSKIIVTVPLGILQSGADHHAGLLFSPSIPQMKFIHAIGFGTVIKIILECKKTFWEEKIKNLGFIFSDETVPTWWTQLPDQDSTITGWLGGIKAKSLESKSNDEISGIAYESLANIFGEHIESIRSFVKKIHVFNWSKHPYALGAYSFPTVETKEARKIFNAPVENTIYFAGEAYYEDPFGGTVEAALKSGFETAHKIIKK